MSSPDRDPDSLSPAERAVLLKELRERLAKARELAEVLGRKDAEAAARGWPDQR